MNLGGPGLHSRILSQQANKESSNIQKGLSCNTPPWIEGARDSVLRPGSELVTRMCEEKAHWLLSLHCISGVEICPHIYSFRSHGLKMEEKSHPCRTWRKTEQW